MSAGMDRDVPETGASARPVPPPGPVFRFLFVESTLAWLLAALFILGGVLAYLTMVKEANPDLAIPAALIKTEWPGAGPTLVEKQVTDVIEKHIKSVENLKRYDSGSRMGLSIISVEFQADAPVAESVQALRTKVWEAIGELPADASRPNVEQVSTTDTPVMTVTLLGDVPDEVLGDAARDLKTDLERLAALRKVDLGGARDAVARVVIDPQTLAGLGLTLGEVRAAIEREATDVPLGRIENDALTADVSLRGRFQTLDQVGAMPVRTGADGSVIRLRDIASLHHDLSVPIDATLTSLDGQAFAPAVSLTLYKMPGSDTVALVQAARAMLDGADLPQGVSARVTDDQSIIVNRKLNEVFVNAVEAVIAVVIVLILLLSWRAALVAGVAVPITFLGALMVLQAMGMTLNTMVVVGMVLALGLLVDVFILVMEGMIQGMRERGLRFARAAAWTVRTYALPAFAGQVTTILALMPLLFLSGVSGKFIRLVPLTAIVCLVVSYAVAFLWAIPASKILLARGQQGGGGAGPLDRLTTAASRGLHAFIARAVVARRWLAGAWTVGAVLLVAAAFVLASGLGMEMYPKEDSRHMAVTVELPPGTPLERSRAVAKTLGDALRDADWLESIILHVGRRSPYAVTATADKLAFTPGSEVIGLSLNLTELDQRDGRLGYTYGPEVRARLAPLVERLPGARLSVIADTGGPGGGGGASFVLQGDSLDQLRGAADVLAGKLAAVPGVIGVRQDMGVPRQDLIAVPQREALTAHGIALGTVASELSLAMNRTEVASLPRPAGQDDVPILLSVGWPGQEQTGGPPASIEHLAALRLTTESGARIPVSALMMAIPEAVPPVILRRDGTRTLTLTADLATGTSPLAFMAQVEPMVKASLAGFPGVHQGVADSADEQSRTAQDMVRLFVVALVLMIATLVLLFRSYRLAAVILCTVPLALIGTFGGFAAISMPISFPAMVGMVSLLGIVVNVAIVMIETMMEHRRAGQDIAGAAAAGAADRLRPIISTTLTTVAGLILLSTASPMWQPLCYAIIFGLVTATVLSMIVIPALFRLLAPPMATPEGEA